MRFNEMVRFYTEDIKFILKNKTKIRYWLNLVAESEIRRVGDINIIFCSDTYLLDINQKFLSHDYFTDIITFDYCESDKLNGDLFISIDTVRDNAVEYNQDFETELHRVIVHGVLHLIGYDDHTQIQEKEIHSKEDYYLSLLNLL